MVPFAMLAFYPGNHEHLAGFEEFSRVLDMDSQNASFCFGFQQRPFSTRASTHEEGMY